VRIGIHTSTAGALANAARQARELGANCFQIFSASPRMWRATMPSIEDSAELDRLRAEWDLRPLVVHDSYLINLAAADEAVRLRSIAAFRGELARASAIGADYLVMHPGSARNHPNLDAALDTLAMSLREASKQFRPRAGFMLLFENTAGAGATMGRSLEELRAIHDRTAGLLPYPAGYCLDTCHLFAAGYDISTAGGLNRTVVETDRVLGLQHVPVIHTNDSRGALGSNLDRHANIGEGQIGMASFRRILRDPSLAGKAFILETPIDQPGDDKKNVDALWRCVDAGRIRRRKGLHPEGGYLANQR
jgi:deoxyribonuclease IV